MARQNLHKYYKEMKRFGKKTKITKRPRKTVVIDDSNIGQTARQVGIDNNIK